MLSFLKDNKLLFALICVTVVAAAIAVGMRYQVETANKTYDIVVDYDEVEKLAEQSEHDTAWWLGQFKEMGIDKVGLSEESIITLMENSELSVTGEVMDLITRDADWKDKYPAEFLGAIETFGYDRFDVIVHAEGTDAVNFVTEAVASRFEDGKYVITNLGDSAYVLLDGTANTTLYSENYKYMNSVNKGFIERSDILSSKLMYISLGLMPEKVEIIQGKDLKIQPRTQSYGGFNGNKYAEAVVAGYERYGIMPDYMLAAGEAVIGLDDGIDFSKNYLKENGITMGLVEHNTQRGNIEQFGAEAVVYETDFNTIRAFSVWQYIQYRYQYYGYEGTEEVENTMFRAITERNIRVIYYKPVLLTDDRRTYMTNVDEYKEMFANLDERLAEHGFKKGEASVMDDYQVNTILKLLIAIGCALSGVLLLKTIIPICRRGTIALCVLGGALAAASVYLLPNTAVLIMSFTAAVIFACLAVTYFTHRGKELQDTLPKEAPIGKIIGAASMTLITAVAIALVGGVFTAAPISSINFMLELDIYRGVKVAQLLPLVYFVVAFIAYFGFGYSEKQKNHLELADIKDIMGLQIKVWMLIILGVIGAVGAYYILRTGHESSIGVSSIEMLFRNKLEEVLIARPRTKEFLFAFPAIMVMVYCAIRRLKAFTFIFGLCGVIGLTSVVNTFMHIRTPLYLGFARTGYSLVFGMILGIVAIIIMDILYKLYMKHLKDYVDKALA